MDMNNLTIIGRLTRDPELKSTNSGKALCRFSIANQKSKDAASFFDCVAWEKTAELISKFQKKGNRIAITGSINQETWEHEGKKMSKVVIIARSVQFLTPQTEGTGPDANDPSGYPDPFSEDIPF